MSKNTEAKMNLNTVIANQSTTRTSNWITFESKKKFFLNDVVTELDSVNENFSSVIKELRNVIALSVKKDYQTVVLSMYFSTTKKSEFWTVDVKSLDVTVFETIKEAKNSSK